MEADENLLRLIPNALEFGTSDHTLHILLSAVFLVTAYVWKKRNDVAGRTLVNHQARTSDVLRRDATELTNAESELKDADLGRSDINHRSDVGRRSDFERRV